MQPDWLYQICYGLEGNRKFKVLLEGERFAIVQMPGSRFMNGQVSQYGSASYHLVDKQTTMRKGYGIMDALVVQEGGRAKLALWKGLVDDGPFFPFGNITPELAHNEKKIVPNTTENP